MSDIAGFPKEISRLVLSQILGLTLRTIESEDAKGTITRIDKRTKATARVRYKFPEIIKEYIKNKAKGITKDFVASKERLEDANADKAEMKTAMLAEELCKKEDMKFVFMQVLVSFKQEQKALSTKLSQVLADVEEVAEIKRIISNAIKETYDNYEEKVEALIVKQIRLEDA